MYTVYFGLFKINALLQIMIVFMQLSNLPTIQYLKISMIVLDNKAFWLQIVQSQIFE